MSDQVMEPIKKYRRSPRKVWGGSLEKEAGTFFMSPDSNGESLRGGFELRDWGQQEGSGKDEKTTPASCPEGNWAWPSLDKAELQTLRNEEREKLDLEKLAQEQDYHGTDLRKVEGKWPGDESYEELLELL